MSTLLLASSVSHRDLGPRGPRPQSVSNSGPRRAPPCHRAGWLWRCGTLALAWFGLRALAFASVTLGSPDGRLSGSISTDASGALVFSVQRSGDELIAPARIGVTLDGADLGARVELGEPDYGTIDESYPVFGGKGMATNRARTLTLPVTDRAGGQSYTLEARAYDDGFAWRLIVPGKSDEIRRVLGEASSWRLPAGSRVWFFERNNDWKLKSYAGEWIATDVENLPIVSKQGPVQGAPLVVELADQAGYLLLTEAALTNYSGLRLRATGGRTVQADFTEGARGFAVEGTVVTPWRVTLCARDLDGLVNSDLVTNLCPPPDPRLYADTSYIRPGRSVWRWWSLGTGTPDQEQRFVDYAVELGFEYSIIDAGWKDWPDAWAEVRRITAYARERSVGIFLWRDYKDLSDSTDNWRQLRTFLDETRDAGAVGVKLDFLNAESKDRVAFTTTALRLAAERRLMVNFHGVTKSTGEARTWPNEITREGIRGLELNKMKEGPIPASHNAALPYTRFAVGAGDYTPLSYSKPGPTTWAHQLATVVQFTSPLQVIAEHPEMLLSDPATRPGLDVLKAIPPTWDATRVLPPSAVGEVSLMARRTGERWFLAVINGVAPRRLDGIDLSFLGPGVFRAVTLTSLAGPDLVRKEMGRVSAGDRLTFDLRAGDGAVVMLEPAERQVVSLGGKWSFALDPLDRGEELGWPGASSPRGWDEVVVPHDFLSDPRYDYTGVAWYRKTVAVPVDLAPGRIWRLCFDNVFQRCRIWLNGRRVGEHEGGYAPFEFDVTGLLKPGADNQIAVAVDNRVRLRALPGARSGDRPVDALYPWLNYGGILGDVRLESSHAVRIVKQKIETERRDNRSAELVATVFLRNDHARPVEAAVTVGITRDDGAALLVSLAGRATIEPAAEARVVLRGILPAESWQEWNLTTPVLYRSTATIEAPVKERKGLAADRHVTTFGFRDVQIRDGRFLLNGRPVRLLGANRARGHPRTGGIDTVETITQDLSLMKAAGLVFARLQHTAPGREVLEWADRHGMLLILEVGVWGYPAEDLRSEELRAAFRQEMREMVELAWNHPSVVGWSLGNEYESWTPEGVAWTRDMAAYVKALDDSRPVTFAAIGTALRKLRDQPRGGDGEHAFDFVDFISTNIYFPVGQVPDFLDPVHDRWPDKAVFISEFGQRTESRTEEQRADYFDAMLAYARDRPWICGLAWWSFNDYASRYPGSGTDGYRRWGLVDEFRQSRELYRHVASKRDGL